MTRLLEDVLTLSQVQDHGHAFTPQRVDLAALCREVLAEVEATARPPLTRSSLRGYGHHRFCKFSPDRCCMLPISTVHASDPAPTSLRADVLVLSRDRRRRRFDPLGGLPGTASSPCSTRIGSSPALPPRRGSARQVRAPRGRTRSARSRRSPDRREEPRS